MDGANAVGVSAYLFSRD